MPDSIEQEALKQVSPSSFHANHFLDSDWLLLILPGSIWGASFLFIAQGLQSMGPNGISFLRIATGFAVLGCFPAARRPITSAPWRQIALLGLLWFAFPLSMFPFAEQRVSSALTGMLNGATSLFATIVACYLARRAPSRGVAIGLAVGLAGTILIASPAFGQGHSSAVGIALIIAALVSYGYALNLARDLQSQYGAVPVIWRAQGVAMVLTAPLGIPDLIGARFSPVSLLSVLALGVFGTGVAYILMAKATGRLGAARASASTFLIPVVALALGVVVLHERVSGVSVAGCLVCLLGAGYMKRASA